ncbi:homeodomain-only protein isoform X2 [Vidua macroura]|uniref:homeodomain-only protein isoform X2 n=1 Tax=Vidua chalybeata TaxID=81927 RepID=UPI0023A89298|nr:homeodomain-only protein isoform X2 [Vidua chalybeata]XP_053832072.1 homeodomain-only protein isoform X2 [Vidua macroura]
MAMEKPVIPTEEQLEILEYHFCKVNKHPDPTTLCLIAAETGLSEEQTLGQAATVCEFHHALCSNWLPAGYRGLQKQKASSQFLQVAVQLIVMQVSFRFLSVLDLQMIV